MVTLRSCQVKVKDRSGQVSLGQVRSMSVQDENRSGVFIEGRVQGQIKLGQVKIWSGQVMSRSGQGKVLSCQVKYVQAMVRSG